MAFRTPRSGNPSSTKIEVGSVVDVPVGPDSKPHPAIVLHVEHGLVIVATGTGTERAHYEHVVVEAGTQAALAMLFYKNTYFYRSNLRAYHPAACRDRRRKAPPDVRRKLRDFYAADLARLAGDKP